MAGIAKEKAEWPNRSLDYFGRIGLTPHGEPVHIENLFSHPLPAVFLNLILPSEVFNRVARPLFTGPIQYDR